MAHASVLLVDNDSGLRAVLDQHVDPARWAIVEHSDAEAAWEATKGAPAELVVLNADLPKGWHLCTQIKRRYPHLPVVLLSYKAPREVFNNHQKLDTRADAYHKLPEDRDRLGVTLSYYATLRANDDDGDGEDAGADVATVAHLSKALEAAQREIKALTLRLEASAHQADTARADNTALRARAEAAEAEQRALLEQLDAFAGRPAPEELDELRARIEERDEHARAQLAELQAALDAAHEERLAVTEREAALIERLAALEAGAANERESNEDRLAELQAEAARKAEAAADAEQAAQVASDEAALAQTTLVTVEQQLKLAREAEAVALERVATIERAWNGVNARVERQNTALKLMKDEVERLTRDKAEVEAALATSRKLMKEYGQAVAHKKEEIAHLESALARAREAAAQAEGRAAGLEVRVQSLEALELALPMVIEEAQSHAAALSELLTQALARAEHFEKRHAETQARGHDAGELARALIQTLEADAPQQPPPPRPADAPATPDFAALTASIRGGMADVTTEGTADGTAEERDGEASDDEEPPGEGQPDAYE